MTAVTVLKLLVERYDEDLTDGQRKAFRSMLAQLDYRDLTEKQEQWVYGIGEKLGVCVAPAANVFSQMSPKERAEHERHVHTKLPWERGEMVLPKKPPQGRAE